MSALQLRDRLELNVDLLIVIKSFGQTVRIIQAGLYHEHTLSYRFV
jgi:hypothetical protein